MTRAARLQTCRQCGYVFEGAEVEWCSTICRVLWLERLVADLHSQRAALQARLDAQDEAHRDG